ncbi:MAG: hypothetical protein AB7K24_14155 [Gemmataceae bacterium]
MYRMPLPFTDAVVLMTPRWQEMSGLGVFVSILICLLVPAAIVMLYLYEMKLVRPRTATLLLGLRLCVIGFLLFVVFLQPILARSVTETLSGRVLVAIDHSESMKVADPQRPAVEKLRLALALKMSDDLVARPQLERWIKDYEAKKPPRWLDDEEAKKPPEEQRKLIDERKRQHDRLIERVDRLTRLGVVEKVLLTQEGQGMGLLDAIAEKHEVKVVGFARDLRDLERDEVAGYLSPFARVPEKKTQPGGDKKNEPAPIPAADDGTDLSLPLVRALERSGQAEGKILGVVLLSDGLHNQGTSGTTHVVKAIEMGQQQMPIYAIAAGARKAPPDISIVWVRAPSAVFKGVDVPVEVQVKVSGLPAQEIALELQPPGGKDPLREFIQHDGTDRFYTRRFQLKLDDIGIQTLAVSVKPVAGEIREENNRRAVAVNVADDKAKVLVIDGEARWEFHYLQSALKRDDTMDVRSIVFHQPRIGKIPEEELVKLEHPRLGWPAEVDALTDYACIVLGDVSPEQMPLAERRRLEKYVAETGGTLVITAGKQHMPLAYFEGLPPVTGPEGEETDPILKLLPISTPRVIKPVQGFRMTLTHAGEQSGFLGLEPEAEKNLGRWNALPRHYWGVIGTAKPAAVPLAYLTSEDDANVVPGQPKDPNDDPTRQRGLIVRQNYGFGRVVYVAVDSTWRWRFKVGDTYHHRFWGQLIRWAASDKPLVTGNEYLRFGTPDPVYRRGEPVDVVVRLTEREQPLGAKALAAARILRKTEGDKEEQAALVQLTKKPAQPRLLEGNVRDLPPGQYQVELAIPDLADKLNGPDGKLRASFTVLPEDSAELVELATNYPLLDELATKSQGKLVEVEDASSIVEMLKEKSVTRTRPVEAKLWEEWPTLVLFLLLLTIEWVARKLAGLP